MQLGICVLQINLNILLTLCITRDKVYFMEDSSVLKSNFGNEEMSHDNSGGEAWSELWRSFS